MCLTQCKARELKLNHYVTSFVLTSGKDEIVISYSLTVCVSMAVLWVCVKYPNIEDIVWGKRVHCLPLLDGSVGSCSRLSNQCAAGWSPAPHLHLSYTRDILYISQRKWPAQGDNISLGSRNVWICVTVLQRTVSPGRLCIRGTVLHIARSPDPCLAWGMFELETEASGLIRHQRLGIKYEREKRFLLICRKWGGGGGGCPFKPHPQPNPWEPGSLAAIPPSSG
jgi:hypothetical protein